MLPAVAPHARLLFVKWLAMTQIPIRHDADACLFHRQLAHFNAQRLLPATPTPQWRSDLQTELTFKVAEGHFLEALRAEISSLLPAAGVTSDAFVAWFESLAQDGPGQNHALFDWLAHSATMSDMRWFLTQEAAGEAGFDDLVAYAQVKLPPQAKLECARNYWDEMGHGKQTAMHGHMLEHMVTTLNLQPSIDTTVWQALALSNTMLGLATSRRYAFHALGALGAIELTAPDRVKQVSAGMKRLGLDGRMRAYFDLHGALDVSHARAWIREVIHSLVDADPACATSIAEGALMRLLCGKRCFDRYALQLMPTRSKPSVDAPAGRRNMASRELEPSF